jgi:hypothetical protein
LNVGYFGVKNNEFVFYIRRGKNVMKKVILCSIVFLILLSSSSVFASGNFNLFFGKKQLEQIDWEPWDDQWEIGYMIDFRSKKMPFNIAIDILGSEAYEKETESGVSGNVKKKETVTTSELDIGIRKIFEASSIPIRPFIGGGIGLFKSVANIDVGRESSSDSDSCLGVWFSSGAYWTINKGLNLGIMARYSKTERPLSLSAGATDKKVTDKIEIEGDAGGYHVGLILGYHWD